jgi:uncharacterized protein (TIGR03000 family)
MRKLLIIAALSATMFMFDTDSVFAGRRSSHGCSSGGCNSGGCSSGCYSGGCNSGGCYSGGCGAYSGGGSYCASCSGGMVVGGCPGGVCSLGGGGMVVASTTPVNTSATLAVALPADATLTIDNTTTTTSTGALRTFRSPALESGKEFEYTLKAQVVRDGKNVEVTKTVTVRAGEETRVQLDIPVQVASAQ